ncbi:hypothetical protein GVN21_19505 [Caulobacter sp. SLTY]|uniref:phage tail tube protein n=1 Tax=Caulobacter sp. SLTY TaxID=2683262 RepID=UPI001412C427|nr:phage tail tube protein [Caulobacter sp. SLTY]NBB17554.1 hypothetical protein [Caulobacter sp. SLTY]
MSGKIHGRSTIKANGKTYKTMKGATLDPGGISREPKPGDNDADAYTETLDASTMECSIQIREGTSLAEIQALTDATLMFVCDTGQTYMIRKGYCGPRPTIVGDGTIKATFHGAPAEEMR